MEPMPAPLLDAHCHLQDEAFAADRAEVMARARQAGVGFFVCNGVSEPDWEALAGLAASDGSILPAYGLHPWYTRQRSHNWLEILERRLSQAPVPVGEIGLDRFLRERDEADMERVFREQLSIARRLERPAFIHCVRAFDWLLDVLRSEPELPAGMLIHACAAPLSAMSELAKRGAYFSFAGTVLAPNNRRAREALLAARGVRVEAARSLGMPLRTLQARIREYGLDIPACRRRTRRSGEGSCVYSRGSSVIAHCPREGNDPEYYQSPSSILRNAAHSNAIQIQLILRRTDLCQRAE
jgi:TatD DNase family protein